MNNGLFLIYIFLGFSNNDAKIYNFYNVLFIKNWKKNTLKENKIIYNGTIKHHIKQLKNF